MQLLQSPRNLCKDRVNTVSAVGIQEVKGTCDAWTRQGQEKDLHLNSEKWIGLWKGRKERTFILSQARIETRYRAGNELGLQGIRLCETQTWKWEANQERKADA